MTGRVEVDMSCACLAVSYNWPVTTTLTFRLKIEQREKLRRKARLLGKTESEFLREMLERELEDRPLSTGLGKLKGALSLKGAKPDGWSQVIRERNWRE